MRGEAVNQPCCRRAATLRQQSGGVGYSLSGRVYVSCLSLLCAVARSVITGMTLSRFRAHLFIEPFRTSATVLSSVALSVLCGVLPPPTSLLWYSSRPVRLSYFLPTKPVFFTSSLLKIKEKRHTFSAPEQLIILSQATKQVKKGTLQSFDSPWSTRPVETETRMPNAEKQDRRRTCSSSVLPATSFWRRLLVRAGNKLSGVVARIQNFWKRSRFRSLGTATRATIVNIADIMSGVLPSSRSLEGRCFLNLEADRSPTPPYMHLSASTYEIESRPRRLLQQRLEETARCLKSAGRARASSAKKEPFVYVGAPGIAFAFLKLASLQTGDKLKSALESVDSFLSSDIVQAGLEEGRIYPQLEPSLLSGPSGVCIVLALRAMQQEQLKLVERGMRPAPPVLVHVPEEEESSGRQERGDEGSGPDKGRPVVPTPLSADFKKTVHQFEQYGEAALEEDAGDEWLYGRAGYLFGCLFLSYLSPGCVSESLTSSVASKIISSGKKRAEESGRSRPPLRFAWHRKEYVGAAHGYFGILHMLLHVRQVRHDKIALAMIHDTLDWLLEMETSKHNWPAVVGDHDAHLCHFCHGATGAALVYSTAATIFKDPAYRQAAERAADCVWRYGILRKGAGICHGIGGSGYSLLAVYQLTQNPAWLDRAVEHAIKAFDEKVQADSRVPDNPYSLFEGVAGAMCLVTDLLKDPKNAAFPFFQIGF